MSEELVEVEIEMADDTFLKLAKLAHEKDVTFNVYCSQLLEEYIKENDNENN